MQIRLMTTQVWQSPEQAESSFVAAQSTLRLGIRLPSAVSNSRPTFTSTRDFDNETAIWDLPTYWYAWKRLAEVLRRQWNV